MAVYRCSARITNAKYTLPASHFEITASSWPVAVYRATSHALHSYKLVRGRRDRPIEIQVTASQRPAHDHYPIREEPNG